MSSRPSELFTWLYARLEDFVAQIQASAPAAIVNVETRMQGDELSAVASGIATPDAASLDLGFSLVHAGDEDRLSATLRIADTGELLASLPTIVGRADGFDTPELRERILGFLAEQGPRMSARLHAEARGSEHEAELIERLREQAERARNRGELEEARHLVRMLTMLRCDEAELAGLVRVEAEALRGHLRQLLERFPECRAAIVDIDVGIGDERR
ncbi:hypothetical protein ACNOYE_32545 [Nannocystaceae bacterium ST9]